MDAEEKPVSHRAFRDEMEELTRRAKNTLPYFRVIRAKMILHKQGLSNEEVAECLST
jgi:hypothetical protein